MDLTEKLLLSVCRSDTKVNQISAKIRFLNPKLGRPPAFAFRGFETRSTILIVNVRILFQSVCNASSCSMRENAKQPAKPWIPGRAVATLPESLASPGA